MVTGQGVDITKVVGYLGYRRVSGYNYDSPWITGNLAIGTTEGSNNLGQITDVFALGQNSNNPNWIDIPNGRNQIWMRDTITLNSSSYGYAEVGYLDNLGYGPAFRNVFETQPAAPVPEPTTVLLLGTGIAGLAGSRIRRKKK